MSKSRRSVITAPVPPAGETMTAKATIPPSKPRNRLAVDPLLRKSGAHDAGDRKGGRKRARVAAQHLRDEIATLSSQGRRGQPPEPDEKQ